MLHSVTATARTIRPHAAASLHGLAQSGEQLLAVCPRTGYLFAIAPDTDDTRVLNRHAVADFLDVAGIALAGQMLWFARQDAVYSCQLGSDGPGQPQLFARLPEEATGIALYESTLYVSCQGTGSIHVFSIETGQEITRLLAPGIGPANLTVRGEELWACDRVEQTVFCMDRATGEVTFSLLTPFPSPTGLTFFGEGDRQRLYVAYSFDEPYIRDNPNADPNFEIEYRDAAFVHPLYFHFDPDCRYAVSNGYLVEMSYVEEISPLDPIELDHLEWRMALPAETHRQTLRSVSAIGLPFSEEVIDGQRVAVFKFERLTGEERFVFGWKAVLEVWGIKYQFQPRDGEDVPELSPEMQQRYTLDDDELAMDTPIIKQAAFEAPGDATNLLVRMYNIRNFVYDKLAYGIKPQIDSPDVVIQRGVASCGEYLGLLLAIARLNGIACRTVGRYKCPPQPQLRHVPQEPDFNHVWMEFYLPGYGWLPMESNPDDINEGGPYPTRFFMGLAWYHAEMGKGIPFETISQNGKRLTREQVGIGDLAINHVRFTVLDELVPTGVAPDSK